MSLKDKIAIITGSSRGIGKATALVFAKEGAKVVVNYRVNREQGKNVVNEIKKNHGESILIQADVSKSEDVEYLFNQTVKTFGTIDILVNNAGVINPKPFLELTVENWEQTFRTNIIGVFLCSQKAAKVMLKKKGGKIINIASIRGLLNCGREGIIDYSASKAAVINFTKTLAKELAPYINVNAVAPGLTETDMARSWDKVTRQQALKDVYLRRLIEPEEIAKAVLFLACQDADSVTGEVLIVDAGYQLK